MHGTDRHRHTHARARARVNRQTSVLLIPTGNLWHTNDLWATITLANISPNAIQLKRGNIFPDYAAQVLQALQTYFYTNNK